MVNLAESANDWLEKWLKKKSHIKTLMTFSQVGAIPHSGWSRVHITFLNFWLLRFQDTVSTYIIGTIISLINKVKTYWGDQPGPELGRFNMLLYWFSEGLVQMESEQKPSIHLLGSIKKFCHSKKKFPLLQKREWNPEKALIRQ